MSSALSHFSIECKLEDARKALYLLCVPDKNANINMTRSVGNRLRELTNNGEVRGGDFYGVKDHAAVTLVASRITYIEKIKDYYERASTDGARSQEKRDTGAMTLFDLGSPDLQGKKAAGDKEEPSAKSAMPLAARMRPRNFS